MKELSRAGELAAPYVTASEYVLMAAARLETKDKLLLDARNAIPERYEFAGVDYGTLNSAFANAGINGITRMDKKCLNIFSEGITFTEGLGVYLEKLAASGIRIAVVAPKDSERAIIDEFNEGKPEDRQIVCGATADEIARRGGWARKYYYRLETENAISSGFNVSNISVTIEKIKMLLNNIAGIVESASLEMWDTARRLYQSAA
jgi:hypothetical protein